MHVAALRPHPGMDASAAGPPRGRACTLQRPDPLAHDPYVSQGSSVHAAALRPHPGIDASAAKKSAARPVFYARRDVDQCSRHPRSRRSGFAARPRTHRTHRDHHFPTSASSAAPQSARPCLHLFVTQAKAQTPSTHQMPYKAEHTPRSHLGIPIRPSRSRSSAPIAAHPPPIPTICTQSKACHARNPKPAMHAAAAAAPRHPRLWRWPTRACQKRDGLCPERSLRGLKTRWAMP